MPPARERFLARNRSQDDRLPDCCTIAGPHVANEERPVGGLRRTPDSIAQEYRCPNKRIVGVNARKAAIRARRQMFIDGQAKEVELYGKALLVVSIPIDS